MNVLMSSSDTRLLTSAYYLVSHPYSHLKLLCRIFIFTVRILYTINSAPQYILARSVQPLSVNVLKLSPPSQTYQSQLLQFHPSITFGRIRLKDCLQSICCSRYSSSNSCLPSRSSLSSIAQSLRQILDAIFQFMFLTPSNPAPSLLFSSTPHSHTLPLLTHKV